MALEVINRYHKAKEVQVSSLECI